MQDLQTWTKTTPILALVGVLVLQLSQGQFFVLIKHPKKELPVKNVILLLSPTFVILSMV